MEKRREEQEVAGVYVFDDETFNQFGGCLGNAGDAPRTGQKARQPRSKPARTTRLQAARSGARRSGASQVSAIELPQRTDRRGGRAAATVDNSGPGLDWATRRKAGGNCRRDGDEMAISDADQPDVQVSMLEFAVGIQWQH
ncbi:hypothetical protein E4U21_002438 [Claviceps maximensis]|nr:hypothetical protein E4U21_002438 [Claviceps maximensis]